MAHDERRIPCPRRPLERHRAIAAPEPPKSRGGRPRGPDCASLGGIIFVLRTGCPWRLLPKKLGCGNGTTCWRRLRDWQEAGVWQQLHQMLLNWLGDEAAIAWCRASVDSLSVRAKWGESRLIRTQLTVESPAPSTTSSWISTASHWLFASPPLTPVTRPSYFRWLMPSLRSSDCGDGQVVPASAPSSCTLKRPTMPQIYGAPCALAVSRRGLLAVGSTRAIGSPPLGGGAYALLATRLPPPWSPLRVAGRSPPGPAPPGLRPDLRSLPRLREQVTNGTRWPPWRPS